MLQTHELTLDMEGRAIGQYIKHVRALGAWVLEGEQISLSVSVLHSERSSQMTHGEHSSQQQLPMYGPEA